jgi:hypothetical protein
MEKKKRMNYKKLGIGVGDGKRCMKEWIGKDQI